MIDKNTHYAMKRWSGKLLSIHNLLITIAATLALPIAWWTFDMKYGLALCSILITAMWILYFIWHKKFSLTPIKSMCVYALTTYMVGGFIIATWLWIGIGFFTYFAPFAWVAGLALDAKRDTWH